MLGLSGNQGWSSFAQVGATTGKQISLAQIAAVTPNSAPNGQTLGGFLVNDTGAAEVQIYDGNGAATTLKAQLTLPSTGASLVVPLGIGPFTQGIWLVVTGGTAPVVTVVYK